MHFKIFFVFWVFFWEGIWDYGGEGESPQEIAGININNQESRTDFIFSPV